MGSPDFPWHGIDKIALLANERPTWHFDLVGLSQAQVRGLPRSVNACERASRDTYMRLLMKADVAISSLAMHRNGLDEASPLKTRECLAVGVPVILA